MAGHLGSDSATGEEGEENVRVNHPRWYDIAIRVANVFLCGFAVGKGRSPGPFIVVACICLWWFIDHCTMLDLAKDTNR